MPFFFRIKIRYKNPKIFQTWHHSIFLVARTNNSQFHYKKTFQFILNITTSKITMKVFIAILVCAVAVSAYPQGGWSKYSTKYIQTLLFFLNWRNHLCSFAVQNNIVILTLYFSLSFRCTPITNC